MSLQVAVIAAAVAVLWHALPADAQSPTLQRTLSFAIPFSIVTIVVIIIFIVVVYMLYRAKRGYFCCLKPSYRVPCRRPQDEESSDDEEEGGESNREGGESQDGPSSTAASALPPNYQQGIQQRPLDIAPPDYRDALQDKIISRAEDSSAISEPTLAASPEPIVTITTSTTPPPPPQEVTTPPQEEEEPPPPPTNQEEEEEVDGTPVTVEPPEDLDDSSGSYDDRTPLNP